MYDGQGSYGLLDYNFLIHFMLDNSLDLPSFILAASSAPILDYIAQIWKIFSRTFFCLPVYPPSFSLFNPSNYSYGLFGVYLIYSQLFLIFVSNPSPLIHRWRKPGLLKYHTNNKRKKQKNWDKTKVHRILTSFEFEACTQQNSQTWYSHSMRRRAAIKWSTTTRSMVIMVEEESLL